MVVSEGVVPSSVMFVGLVYSRSSVGSSFIVDPIGSAPIIHRKDVNSCLLPFRFLDANEIDSCTQFVRASPRALVSMDN